jgi:hypothetical protein
LDINQYLKQTPNEANKLSIIFSISEDDYKETAGQSVKFVLRNHAWQTTLPYGIGFFDDEDIDLALINPLPSPLVSPINSLAKTENPNTFNQLLENE